MHDLVIYGAGGFGRETALMIQEINERNCQWNVLGFCDDTVARGTAIDDSSVLGNCQFINEYKKPLAIVIAVADCATRKKLKEQISNREVTYPSLIHPSVLTGSTNRNKIGEGVILTAGNILTTNIDLQPFVIVNLACTIGHDVTLGKYCTVMPGCSLSGNVTVREETLIGTGVRILPNLTIGKRSRIGAGAVVVKSVGDSMTVVGIPAEPIKTHSNKLRP